MKIEEEIEICFRNDYHKALINLNYTVNKLNYNFFKHLRKHKITQQQYNILRILERYHTDGPVSINFIKERMLDKSSDVSRIVEKLFEKKMINRKENKIDRRQKDVEITRNGINLLEKMGDCEEIADNLLKNLSIKELTELNNLLDKIRE